MIWPEFPNLAVIRKTSDEDKRYNCIAWAFGDNSRWWWPVRGYWPKEGRRELTIDAFVDLLVNRGWEDATDARHEMGFVKFALYARGGEPTHAARQLVTGGWTSKLGREIDLSHTL